MDSITAAEPQTCDRTSAEGVVCGELATQAYSWEWGETGVCCDKHATLLQQIAAQVNRALTLSPLQRGPQPIGRDERITLTARALVLEEELEAAKIRGLELYRINTQCVAEMKLAKVREDEARVQLIEAEKQVTRLIEDVAKRDAENARLLSELQRLQLLESFQPAAPAAPA